MTFREEIIGPCRLILADCRQVLPTLGRVDAVVTDPPYGLGDKWQGGTYHWRLNHLGIGWDKSTVDYVNEIPSLAKQCIIWGGHLYNLPPARGWLIWDKIPREFTSGDCELAWTTIDQPIRAISLPRSNASFPEGKNHPTQKPLRLMEWCLSQLTSTTIVDPFMGSGTTGVAAVKRGRRFIGIEIEERYFSIAVRRISAAVSQPDLFIQTPPARPVQEELPL